MLNNFIFTVTKKIDCYQYIYTYTYIIWKSTPLQWGQPLPG